MKSISFFSVSHYSSVGEFTVAVLQHPAETRNKLIRVHGQRSSWNGIVKVLEKVQSAKYTVTYTSISEAEAKEAGLWKTDLPVAVRLNLRRCMGTGNANFAGIDNGLFPEVRPTTNLESIARKALTNKGCL